MYITDEQVVEQFEKDYTDDIFKESVKGLYRCYRGQGLSEVNAYVKTLETVVEIFEKNEEKVVDIVENNKD